MWLVMVNVGNSILTFLFFLPKIFRFPLLEREETKKNSTLSFKNPLKKYRGPS